MGTGDLTTPDAPNPSDNREHHNEHHRDNALDAPSSEKDDISTLKSPGVARIEALSATLTLPLRIALFLSLFLVAYAYGLDGTLRGTYQPYATSSFGTHSLLSTVNVVRAVIAAAAQPTAAKVADVFGRVELLCASVVFYVIGTALEAASHDVATFAGGVVLYQIGYTMVLLLVEVIIADLTSTRSRLFFSCIPNLPFIINTWVSGNVTSAVLGSTTWRWGIAMWCIIYPVCAMPLIITLCIAGNRAKKAGTLDNYRSSMQVMGFASFAKNLFVLLDVIGIILVIAVFALILVPLTTAGGFSSKWQTAGVIAPLVVGVVCIPAFIMWELRGASHPLVPFKFMKDRSVWAPIAIAVFFNFAYGMQADYLYTVLIVAFDFSVTTATRVQSFYSFVSVIVGPLLGLVVYKVRRLKIFIIIGTVLYMVAFGLLIRYRGSTDGSGGAGVIGAQILLGFAGGLFPYPTLASLQVYLKHENLAVVTGIFLAVYNIGSAFGNTVSGAIWTQLLPGSLEEKLTAIGKPDLAAVAYAAPFNVTRDYPIGTPERAAMIDGYQHIQRLLTITGICLCVPLIGLSFLLRNPRLTDEQNIAEELPSQKETDGEKTRV